MLDTLHVLAMVFASWRLTEALLADRISGPFREALAARAGRRPIWTWLHYLVNCPRCSSVEMGAIAAALYAAWPWLNWPFALSWLFIVMLDVKGLRRSVAQNLRQQDLGGMAPISGGANGEATPPTPPTPVDFATTQNGPPGFVLVNQCTATNTSQFNSCLSAAAGGTKIVLTHGVTYTGPWQLTPVAPVSGQSWVWITTDDATLPAPGTRVTRAADSGKMPFLTMACTTGGQSIFTVQDSAHHWWFTGVRVGVTNGSCQPPFNTLGGAFLFQSPSATQATLVHHIVLDRVILHSDDTHGGSNMVQGLMNQGAIINSHIEGSFASPNAGSVNEIHAIAIAGGGPNLIFNNFIEGASCGVFLADSGGAPNDVPFPHDLTLHNNTLNRRKEWNIASSRCGPQGFDANLPIPYSLCTGTAGINGSVITLNGFTVSPTWADGATYFQLLTAPGSDAVIKILSVDTVNNRFTLVSSWPDHQGQSGLAYRVTTWAGNLYAGRQSKNLYESKGAFRISIQNNRFQNSWSQSQIYCLNLTSSRGAGGGASDITVAWNYIQNCGLAVGTVVRATVASDSGAIVRGIDNDGSGHVRITFDYTGAKCLPGDTVQIGGTGGTPSVDGTWTMGVVDSVTCINDPNLRTCIRFVLQGSTFGSGYTLGGGCQVFHQGTATSKIAIHDNVFEDAASAEASNAPGAQGFPVFYQANAQQVLTPNGGASDAALSTTGRWGQDDFAFYHNTVANPTVGNGMAGLVRFLGSGNGATTWQALRWTWRDNVTALSNPTGNTNAYCVSTFAPLPQLYGTQAWDKVTDPTTRVFKRNATWYPCISDEWAHYSGADGDEFIVLTNPTGIGFTNYAIGTVLNYQLNSVYTGTCTTNGTTIVNCTTPPPASVFLAGRGIPFKVTADPDANYRMICGLAGTQITLCSAYPNSQVAVPSKISLVGWASDCAARTAAGLSCDVGADIATLNSLLGGGSLPPSPPAPPTGLHLIP